MRRLTAWNYGESGCDLVMVWGRRLCGDGEYLPIDRMEIICYTRSCIDKVYLPDD